ncbi:butyrophilin-like protein 1 [Pseudorca crassidens]|uniref:butyrophilin-like protein 1 n=1 Tax=Pseudorca crassidens TaxID=82174 RepID=UPI00352C63CB
MEDVSTTGPLVLRKEAPGFLGRSSGPALPPALCPQLMPWEISPAAVRSAPSPPCSFSSSCPLGGLQLRSEKWFFGDPAGLCCRRVMSWVSTVGFFVTGPLDPIVAVLGGDTELPCHVFPPISAEDMELRWFRSKSSEAVFIYQNRVEQNEGQMARYAGRTSLVSDFLAQGQAAVRIQRVQVSDNGLYTCFFRKGGFYEEASLELKVAGVGSAPQVRITGPEEDGVRVVCTASGWFPKPQVQWRDLSGEKFPAFSEAHSQDAEGLFSVEVALVVRDSSAGNVTCSVLNTVLDQEKAMAIFIPEPFFPQASPWKLAFLVSLTVLMALLLGAGYYTRREHFRKLLVMQEKENLRLDKEQDWRTKEEVLKDTDELRTELGWRKSAYLAAWRKAQLYADWRKEKFQACE